MTRARRRRWSDVVLRPHVLLAALIAVAGVPWLVQALRTERPSAPTAFLVEASERGGVTRDVPIVVIDRDALRRTQLVAVTAPDDDAARLAAAMAALRDVLVDEGAWPPGLEAPVVLRYDVQRRVVVVVDVADAAPSVTAVVDLPGALAAVRSLQETAVAHGADEVRITVGGAPSSHLWGLVALP